MTEMWTRPMAEVQQFAANEYVAACGDSGVVYNFKCDAPGGYYYPVYMYNGTQKKQLVDGISSYYHACGETHEAESSDGFYKGFIDYDRDGKEDKGESVIIWRGKKGNNVHCTTNLDMSKWETAKS